MLCLSEVGPGGLVTAGSSSGAEHSLDWTLAGWEKQTCFNQQGETKTDPRFTLNTSRMRRTQNPVQQFMRRILSNKLHGNCNRRVCLLFFPFTPHTPIYCRKQHLFQMTFSSNTSNNSTVIMLCSHVD